VAGGIVLERAATERMAMPLRAVEAEGLLYRGTFPAQAATVALARFLSVLSNFE
jgi:hypothetical protein